MARNATSSDRSIPHLRDIFWSGSAPSGPSPHGHAPHGVTRGEQQWRRHDDVNELAYQFQNDARISNRGKGIVSYQLTRRRKRAFLCNEVRTGSA